MSDLGGKAVYSIQEIIAATQLASKTPIDTVRKLLVIFPNIWFGLVFHIMWSPSSNNVELHFCTLGSVIVVYFIVINIWLFSF